jgi:hypothetical protein
MRTPILAAAFAMLAAGPAVAQPTPAHFGEGTHAFRAVLKSLRLEPLPEGNDLLDQPLTKILIAFGRTEVIDQLVEGRLKRFIENGGAVLIATDRPTSDALFKEIGIRISGDGITTIPRAGTAYRNMPECPLVWEYGRPAGNGQPPSGFLFQGMGNEPRVASNLPSAINESQYVLPLATLFAPEHGFSTGRGRFRQVFNQQSLFAVMGSPLTWKKGRLLVMADHSIFINDMMLQPDNDNVTFAINAVRWLADAGNGQRRTNVVFFDDGQIQTDFNVSLEYPQPKLPPLVPLADEIVVGLERENAFNKTLLEMAGGPGPILRTIAFLLTLGLLFFGLYRFLQGRHRPESRVPRLPGRLAALTAAVPAVERRHQAVIAQGNLAEAARELAHQAFAAVGLTPTADAPPPAVSVVGGWPFRARRWRREVNDLWTLAARGPVRRISPNALRRLDLTLHNLLAAVAAGEVRLAAADSAI